MDSDGDGLGDEWEVTFGLNPLSAEGDDGASGDPDGDGRTNLREHADGTHPRGFFTRYMAEGATGGRFDTRLALANPEGDSARVLVIFARTDGSRVALPLTLAAMSRRTLSADAVPGLESTEFSATIESDGPVAADRTMSWNVKGHGAHSGPSLPAASRTWFVAEGRTRPGFNLFYLIYNPTPAKAEVTVRFLPSSGGTVLKTYHVRPNARLTLWINEQAAIDPSLAALSAADVAATIESTVPVVVERTTYVERDKDLLGGGASSAGADAAAPRWFFAEGGAGPEFATDVTLFNPNENEVAVEATYLLPSGDAIAKQYSVAPRARLNVRVGVEDPRLEDTAFAVRLTSLDGTGIIAERSMWSPGSTAGTLREGHSSIGATTTASRWALAEGEVGGPQAVETWIAIANAAAVPGTVNVTLIFEDGTRAERAFPIKPTSRFSLNVGQAFPEASETRFAAVVEARGTPAPEIVVERTTFARAVGAVKAATSAPAMPLPAAGATRTGRRAEEALPLGMSATSATTGTQAGAVYNLRIMTDASPDLTDLDGLVHSTTSRWTDPADKVWALYYWSHVLKRQTSPMVLHGTEVTDPIRNLADFGFTMCSTISGINQVLYEALGLRHEYWDICNHTVSAVEFGGKFNMIDSSMSNLVTLDDGVTLASVTEAAADSARLVRERSLYGSSPNGFLTGADAQPRNLTDFVKPDGTVVNGFADAFCAGGLKYRDFYYNWNSGHRVVLNLRDDESYTRYYRRLGEGRDYWVGSEKISSPDPASTFEIDAANKYRLRGNGLWSFSPDLTATGWAPAAYRAANIIAATRGLGPAVAGLPAEVVYKVQAANAIASQQIYAQFARTDSLASASVSLSLNHGLTWTDVGTVSGVGTVVPLDVTLRDQVNGAYETLVRVRMNAAAGTPEGIALTGLRIDTITQVNARSLPKLNIGRNEIFVGAGDQSDTMVLWPDLRADLWKRDAFASNNIASQGVNVPRPYTAVAYPAVLSQDAYLVYRMEAPSDIRRVVYGGRLHNFAPGSYIDFLHSFDGGATWTRSYRLSDTSKPYDVIHYETVSNIPSGVRTVLFKYYIHNTNPTVSRAAGLYSVRMEANHGPSQQAMTPLDLTFRWKEIRADRTQMERTHRQRITQLPATYVVNVGGMDHPVMESMRVSLADDRDTTPFGYSDGTDAGGQKYVHRKRLDGANLAKNKPYSFSRAPSAFQSSAGAGNTTILTDGVVGAPMTGGMTYWWGQCWTSGSNVDLQIDLGRTMPVGAFRAHLFGYPFWDALKGQVRDIVEVQTSTDGVAFVRQGFLNTTLWHKDVPINYMLQDDDRATAWNFELALPSPVSARYVRYRTTPARQLCASELQVLDRVAYQPFDIRIALPGVAAPPPPAGGSDPTEIVLHAASAARFGNGWTAVADATAAGGSRLQSPDAGAARVAAPLAAPASYAELTFNAEAARPYRLWVRGRAERDYWGNDSIYVQFDAAVSATGTPVYRIGSTDGAVINLEDCSGCGLSGWGWQDNGYGAGVLGPVIYFATAGVQRIRIQTREDGFGLDQVVLSAVTYMNRAPGALKNDTTVLAR